VPRLVARTRQIARVMLMASVQPALAGPPYVSDDPEPTDYKHFEIYSFGNGTSTNAGSSGETGIDFNYGAAPDLQLTATVPAGYVSLGSGEPTFGLGNVELAAKYRFLHQDTFGWDVAFFPRVFLPSGSGTMGDNHASLLLPVWVQKDWNDRWSVFGGGGCAVSTQGSKDYCLAGAVLTYQVLPKLQIGVELFQRVQTPTAHRRHRAWASDFATTSMTPITCWVTSGEASRTPARPINIHGTDPFW
jgi:Putative MetA-pathway of phenol degradation